MLAKIIYRKIERLEHYDSGKETRSFAFTPLTTTKEQEKTERTAGSCAASTRPANDDKLKARKRNGGAV